MTMIVDSVTFAGDFYRGLMARRLIEGGVIEIPYRNAFSFTQNINGASDTLSFVLRTQSLDYLIGTFRDNRYAAPEIKKVTGTYRSEEAGLGGYDKVFGTNTGTCGATGSQFCAPLDTSYYKFNSFCMKFLMGYAATGTGLLRSTAQSLTNDAFSQPPATYQFSVGNTRVPTWPASVNEVQALTRAAFDLASDSTDKGRIVTTNQFRHDAFAFVQNFAHNSDGEKIISGKDTRGDGRMSFIANNLVMPLGTDPTYDHIADPYGVQTTVWALTTSTLQISAGQNIAVIF
jgi:hypothetical protein